MKKGVILRQVLPYLLIFSFFLLLVGAYHHPLISRLTDFGDTMSGAYFDLQGIGLTIGKLDVPCESLRYEAFHVGGKCYGYFGLTPSFFRIMLNGLCTSCFAQWNRLMMLAAGMLFYTSLVLLARRAFDGKMDGWRKQAWSHGFAMVMALGGSLTYIVSNPYGYHEAILWAGAFTLLGFWAIARYADGGESWAWRLSLAANFLALHSRFTLGLALAGATCLWLAAPVSRFLPLWLASLLPFSPEAKARPIKFALVGCLLIFGMSLTPLVVQHLKFGQFNLPTATQPFYADFPERLEKIKEGRVQLKNFSCAAALYFSPSMIGFQPDFPWIVPSYREYWLAGTPMPDKVSPYCRDSNVESFDPIFSLPYGLPVPFLLFGFGIIIAIGQPAQMRRWFPLLAGGLAACLPLLFLSSVTYRYSFDFMPLFAIGGIIAWQKIAEMPRSVRLGAILSVLLLVSGALTVNFSATLYSGSPQPYWARIAAGLERIVAPSMDDTGGNQ